MNGAVGLPWTGDWQICQAAVETVLRGGSLQLIPDLLDGSASDEASEVTCPADVWKNLPTTTSNDLQQQQQLPVLNIEIEGLPESEEACDRGRQALLQPIDLDLRLTPRPALKLQSKESQSIPIEEKLLLPDPLPTAAVIRQRTEAYGQAWKNRPPQSTGSSATSTACRGLLFHSDVAFKGNSAWMGIYCTNSFGSLIAAWSFNSATTTPLLGELEGLIKAVAVAQELNIHDLHLYSDAKDLIDTLQSKSFDSLPQVALLLDSFLSKLSAFRT